MARGGGMEAYGALVLRVAIGAIYMMHAYRVLFIWGPGDVVSFENTYALPLPAASIWYLIIAHGLGGLLLILGVLARWAALVNIPIMAVVVFLIHWKQGFYMSHGGGYEFSLLLLAATIAQAFLGAGAFTLRK